LNVQIKNARIWYFINVNKNPDKFINWIRKEYGIWVIMTGPPETTAKWVLDWVEDEEKATLFKIEWS
jgi:hypothetical protein